ncbi:unnamed protein product, partial [Laminaria digitata]
DSALNALVFGYTVQDGHETAALEVTSAFALNGTVRLNATYATSSINITLPEAGESESLSYGRTIAIDTTAPAVVNVTSTQPNGTYTTGAVIGAAVRFSAAVVVVNGGGVCEGLPVLRLDSSGENGDKNATYVRGNGTAELVFEYEVS